MSVCITPPLNHHQPSAGTGNEHIVQLYIDINTICSINKSTCRVTHLSAGLMAVGYLNMMSWQPHRNMLSFSSIKHLEAVNRNCPVVIFETFLELTRCSSKCDVSSMPVGLTHPVLYDRPLSRTPG